MTIMQLIPLDAVKHLLKVGAPLPFNVRMDDRLLLLARGQVLDSQEQLQALVARGMMVDIEELQTPQERLKRLPRAQLPAQWGRCMDRVAHVLRELPSERCDEAVDEIAQPLIDLVECDPDLAIFQVLRQHGSAHMQYGVNHSVHCAVAAFLAAHRLEMDDEWTQRAFKAALT